MSKFKNITVGGNGNVIGTNVTQNNVKNYRYDQGGNRKGDDQGDIIPVIVLVGVALAASVWWFFKHIDQIYSALIIAGISSGIPALSAIAVMSVSHTIDKGHIFRSLTNMFIAAALLSVVIIFRQQAPSEVVEISHKYEFIEFWKTLTNYGRDLVVANFTSALLILVSILLNVMSGIRQLAYSLANPRGEGVWFEIYLRTRGFRVRYVTTIVSVIFGFVYAIINGYIL